MLGSFGILRALMNFQRNIFWLTHDLTFEDNRLLAWLGSPITDCSQFVHLRAPEPAAACILQLLLRERHCWDTPGSRAEQILYSQVSHPQCPFCHHTGLELALNWLYNTSTKSSSGSSSEMFYCFLYSILERYVWTSRGHSSKWQAWPWSCQGLTSERCQLTSTMGYESLGHYCTASLS